MSAMENLKMRVACFAVAALMLGAVGCGGGGGSGKGALSPDKDSGKKGLGNVAVSKEAAAGFDRALDAFAERFPRQARVVEMRYFAELELEEIAHCLEVSPTTVKRDWSFARAWLRAELAGTA